MDISMPDMNGLEATREILKNNPGTEVLILSMHESDQIVHDVLAAGARGYILKQDAGTRPDRGPGSRPPAQAVLHFQGV